MARKESAQPQNPVLDETIVWNPTLSRRDLLRLTAFGAISSGLAACGFGFDSTKPVDELNPTERLFKYLEDLPEGTPEARNLKDLLRNHAASYFTSPPTKSVDLGGDIIPVFDPLIISRITTDPRRNFHGNTNFFGDSKFNTFVVDEDAELILPIPRIIRPEEIPQAEGRLLKDGSFKSPISFRKGEPINVGLSPIITIEVPSALKEEERPIIQFREQFIYVKEVATLMAFDLWVAQMSHSMRQLGLDRTAKVIDQDGKSSEISVLSSMIQAVFSESERGPGRMVALVDLAGYFFSFRAISGTSLGQAVRTNNPKFEKPMDAAASTDVGNSDYELLSASIDWAFEHTEEWQLRDPNKSLLDYVGDLYKVP